MIQLFVTAQSKRGKTPNSPVEPLNNVSVSCQVTVPFVYGTGVLPIVMTVEEAPALFPTVVSSRGTLTPDGSLPTQLQAVEVYITSHAACNSAYAITAESLST
jgi:hypothetical protein